MCWVGATKDYTDPRICLPLFSTHHRVIHYTQQPTKYKTCTYLSNFTKNRFRLSRKKNKICRVLFCNWLFYDDLVAHSLSAQN